MTAAAVLSWVYFFGWPWFAAYREQARFEQAASQLNAGESTFSVMGALSAAGLSASNRMAPTSYTSSDAGTRFGVSRFVLTNGVYFVYLEYPNTYSGGLLQAPSTRVEIFRLPPAPQGYKARRKIFDPEHGNRTEPPKPGESPENTYSDDFIDYLKSDRHDRNGLQFELIHSEPKAKP
ncbi:MAG TPA: hypothetical protein VGI75_03730 [Pirellulales bacterium]